MSVGCVGDPQAAALGRGLLPLALRPLLGALSGTVVYVLDHSESGTLGVVLGRPSQVDIRDVLPGWCDLAARWGEG